MPQYIKFLDKNYYLMFRQILMEYMVYHEVEKKSILQSYFSTWEVPQVEVRCLTYQVSKNYSTDKTIMQDKKRLFDIWLWMKEVKDIDR
jgi:hypothetical protein